MKLKVTVLGTRGIPNVQGGVETHCQNLYPEIYQQNHADICVIARSPYVDYRRSEYKGVRLKSLWAPKSRKFEAIIHSTLAAFSTLFDGSNVVHVHAVGPGLVVPLLRLLGKRVVFTHHGPDYDRQKWGKMAKEMLRLGEKWAVKYANEVIVISEVINTLIKTAASRRRDATGHAESVFAESRAIHCRRRPFCRRKRAARSACRLQSLELFAAAGADWRCRSSG